jgi:hypothetical protein
MKRIILFALTGFALFASLSVSAQNVAINATGASPDPSAMLDVNATNAGLLVPRVTLASLNDGATIVSPATSLLVYNTGGALVAGYYYNSGTPAAPVWTVLSTGTGNYWSSNDGINIFNTNTGSVSIGTTTPGNNAQVVYGDGTTGLFGGTVYQNSFSGTGSYVGFVVGQNNYGGNDALVWNFEDGPIYFGTNSTEAAIIGANGNVGIGTATPAAKTEITAFGPTNNIYTTASGFGVLAGLATYESDSTATNEKTGIYSFVDGSTLENEGFFGEAGSSATLANIGVLGRVSFAPPTGAVSGAIWGNDVIGSANTFAGYFNGKVLTNGNTSIFGNSPQISPSVNFIGFDASAYSANNAVDDSVSDAGVLGYSNGSTFFNTGVTGISGSTGIYNVGLLGLAADGPVGSNFGLYSAVQNTGDYAGFFQGNVSVFGSSSSISPSAVTNAIGLTFDAATFSENTTTDNTTTLNAGVLAYGDGNAGYNAGVFGIGGSTAAGYNYGLYGFADDGPNGSNIAIEGEADSSADYAGAFTGTVIVEGDFTATGVKAFTIDHPLDPANKILRHAAIESNEVLDMYSGNITTDANGYATVELPDYFETINKDFRYQLTVMGTFAQAIIKQKISSNQFIIQTNQPNVEVSWQVAGVRNDKQMQAHPFVAEEAKTSRQAGKYFQPALYGQPASAGMIYMPKGKVASARRSLPSLKALAGSTYKPANSTRPVFKGNIGAGNGGLKKPMASKNIAPVYPANSLLGKAAQAKAAANNTTPKK